MATTVGMPRAGSCMQDAMMLLHDHRKNPARIVDVHTDAILWIDKVGQPRTTFVRVKSTGTGGIERELETHPGFVALAA